MKRYVQIAVGALLPALLLAGCDFLSGTNLGNDDPNNPTSATREQMLIAVTTRQTIQQTGSLARVAGMWMQQMAGTDRQYRTLDLYNHTGDDFTNEFANFYTGAGLLGIRMMTADAEEAGDKVFAGVAKVWEAFSIGTAASLWGDIPYSEAAGEVKTPKLDKQADVYAAVQKLLDEAVADLTSGAGKGPGKADMIYGGDAVKWVQAAYTLKARYYLHWAAVDPANYARALAAAQKGIASSANDFRTYQSTTPGEENVWYQFMFRDRDSYIRVGKFLVDLMSSRGDPRMAAYFSTNASGEFAGAAPGEGMTAAHSRLSSTRGSAGFRQPLITWAENELIMAEAAQHAGDDATARAHLNAVRAAAGLGDVTVSGAALLQEIMTEKYIALFQNIEVWNDYKRTCLPAITPVAGKSVPRRLHYGTDEWNANPENIPDPQSEPLRNANDPRVCG